MGLFSEERLVAATCDEAQLKIVANEIGDHFNSQGYSVSLLPVKTGYQVSMHQGGVFNTLTGTNLDLRIMISSTSSGTCVQCGVGIIGQQAIATAVTLLIFSPLIIVQLWGLAQQSGVDDQAMAVAVASIERHGSAISTKS